MGGELTVLEKAVCRAVVAVIALILFVLAISIWNMQEQINRLNNELVLQQEITDQQIKELNHKVEVYKNICDSVIYGREGGW